MALTPEEVAALSRLATGYNGNAYNAQSNPLGFARGGNQIGNFIAALRDTAAIGQVLARTDDLAARFEAAVAAIEAGPVTSVNGMSGAVVLPEVPKVLPPIVTQPAQGSTPSLTGGALLLSVDRLTSLYGEVQKTIRFRIATAASFASNTIVHDTGVLTQTGVSASLANAQTKLTGGTTYYIQAIQTDAKDVSSGWSAPVSFVFPRIPAAPVMSAPANGATNVGAQNQPVTFTASTYSHPSGVAQASRRFEFSKDDFATIGATLNGSTGQNSATMASPKDVLTAGTAWKVRCVDVDANGGTATGAATGFTTVAQYKPNVGEAYEGGFLAFERFGDGNLFDLVTAAKSTEASRAWTVSSYVLGSFSRTNGPGNTNLSAPYNGGNDLPAMRYARELTIGGTAGYLAAIDEARAISSKLKPSAATVAAFQSGGSEVFDSNFQQTSTELDSSNAAVLNPVTGQEVSGTKTTSRPVRAIKRIAVTPPYPIGTAMEGGYLAAYFTDLSSGSPVTYMLIVADKATEVTRQWSSESSVVAMSSRTSGVANDDRLTVTGSAISNYPAFGYCRNLVSGSKDDWYLGAIDEMLAIARMNSQLPSGQQFVVDNNYWSSTEADASNAKRVLVSATPSEATAAKSNALYVRPIRRVPLPA